jgi:hypothetical protein
MSDPISAASAAIIFLTCTASILGMTFFWAMGNRHPVLGHVRLTGRPAAPYWYSPTGFADERGITSRILPALIGITAPGASRRVPQPIPASRP